MWRAHIAALNTVTKGPPAPPMPTNERPSSYRRQRGMPSATPFRGGPILNLPEPIGRIVFWTAIIFFVSFFLPSPFNDGPIFLDLAFIPVRFLALWEEGRYLEAAVPLLGHMFLHGDFLHIGSNMLWLMVFGSGTARRLCVEGVEPGASRHNILVFLAFYVTCGIAGGLTHFALHPYDVIPMVGASGAISGLMGGTLRFALRLYAPLGASYGPLAPVWARPVLVASALYIGLNVATGVAGAAGMEGAARIAWEAHVGGFLFGLFAFPLFDKLARRPKLPFGI